MGVTQWIIITILLAFIGLLLQVAGYVAPMWIWLETDSFLVGVGLWFTTGCGLSGTCGENTTTPEVSFIYATDGMYRQTEFDAVRALETLGLGAATFLLLVLVVYRMGYGKWDRMGQLNWAAFCLSSLAWLLILAGLVVYCAFFWPVVGTSPLLTRRSFPWSLLMCLLAAFFFIVVCVLIRVKCRDASDYVKNAIPTSGDHKLDLNPVTKTGLMNRYFSPSPYQEDRRSVPGLSAYHDEGSSIYAVSSRKHLLGAETHRGSAYDNLGFQGTQGSSYRYLTVQGTDHLSQTETMMRRPLPLRVVTDNAASTSRHVSTANTAYVTHSAMDDETLLLRDHNTDSRFTNDGRLMAKADYLGPERTVKSGSSQEAPRGSGHYTTHTNPLPTSQVQPGLIRVVPHTDDADVKGYDPTYLYRPYSEHIY